MSKAAFHSSHSPVSRALELLMENHGVELLFSWQWHAVVWDDSKFFIDDDHVDPDQSFINTNNNNNNYIPENKTVSFPTPSFGVNTVQESTSTLLAARGFAKAGNAERAWQAIESLLAGQYSGNRFLPKYRYSHRKHSSQDNESVFIANTTIPNWPLFGKNIKDVYNDKDDAFYGSGLVSALPLHATIVLEVYAWTGQNEESAQRLARAFSRIYRYHKYLRQHRNTYNVIHPWETLTDPHLDEYWDVALDGVYTQMKLTNWTPPFEIPTRVKESFDYVPRVYKAALYLLECHDNVTSKVKSGGDADSIVRECPFAVRDVAYAAVWAKANSDLREMGQILWDKQIISNMNLLNDIQDWAVDSQQILDSLWSPKHQRYLSKAIQVMEAGEVQETWLQVPDASNFVGLWHDTNESWMEREVLGLMQHRGRFAFDCGVFPLWSVGGCSPTTQASISPLLNFLVTKGLKRNDANGLGYYMSNSTLDLVCGRHDDVGHDRCPGLTFPVAYDARNHLPLGVCETCTLTAAVTYNLLLPDATLVFSISPPLRSSWVIVLVVVELIVAFVMGVSCLFLSLSVMSRLGPVNDVVALAGMLDRTNQNDQQPGEGANFFAAYETLSDYDNDNEYYDTTPDDITEPTAPSKRRQ